jgi:hypothetical protein
MAIAFMGFSGMLAVQWGDNIWDILQLH